MQGEAWPEARVSRLKELLSSGLSASGIARELGGVTRNGVISKVHRMGLSLPNGGTANMAHRIKERVARAPRKVSENRRELGQQRRRIAERMRRRDDYIRPDVADDLPPDSSPFAVALIDLKPEHCRFPLGDPRDLHGFRFCGAEVHPERPYCTRHCRIAYRRPGERAVDAPQAAPAHPKPGRLTAHA